MQTDFTAENAARLPTQSARSRVVYATPNTSGARLPDDDMAFVRKPTIRALWPVSSGMFYDWIARGKAPKPLKLSARCSVWRVGDWREFLRDPNGWTADKAMDAPKLSGQAS